MSETATPVFDAGFNRQLEALILWRRDERHFRPDPIPNDVLQGLLDAAGMAPSVGLSQPWRFIVVDDPGRRAAIIANFERCNEAALRCQSADRVEAYAKLKLAGLRDAPCHLAVCVDPDPAQGSGLGRMTMPQTVAYSAVMAIHTLWLVARARGIGVGWVSILDADAALATLDVPRDWQLVGYLCLGFPNEAHAVPELEREGWEVRRRKPAMQR